MDLCEFMGAVLYNLDAAPGPPKPGPVWPPHPSVSTLTSIVDKRVCQTDHYQV